MRKFLLLIIVSVCCFYTVKAQTPEQTKSFINKSPISIWKVQKELAYRKVSQYSTDLKAAYQNQLYAIELYKQGQFKDALAYSYAARETAMGILGKIGVKIPKETLIEPFETDFFKIDKNFKPRPKLNATQLTYLNTCDVLDRQQTNSLPLQILNQ